MSSLMGSLATIYHVIQVRMACWFKTSKCSNHGHDLMRLI